METENEYKKVWKRVSDEQGDNEIFFGPHFSLELLSGHLLFSLARYKFAQRLLERTPKLNVLELGCNEGIGTISLASVSNRVVGVDFDERAIGWAKKNLKLDNVDFVHDDFIGKKYGEFDAVVSIDVIEHIPLNLESKFLSTLSNNLKGNGFCLVGTPNKSAEAYGSPSSKIGHINMYDERRLKESPAYLSIISIILWL